MTFHHKLADTHLIVDLEGYFSPEGGSSSVGRYVAQSPSRICDTRPASFAGSTN